ncbi:MAG: hypothetical protein KGQ89_08780, partial [Verrucomicrobia bacterium]|nr:hypothetical protein [Verrucomicrobiota bacterium]
KRDAMRSWKAALPNLMAAELAPPYPDFFQSKLIHAIQQQSDVPDNAPAKGSTPRWWSRLWMPVTALSAMALCFLGGMQFTKKSTRIYSMVVYTPELGVKAEYYQSSPAEGSVIVLNGVPALPDSFEVPHSPALDDNKTDVGKGNKKNADAIVAP